MSKQVTIYFKEMSMRIFILERTEDGEIYAYVENAEHHITVNHNPDSGRNPDNRVTIDTENECLVTELLEPGQWTSFVVNDFIPQRNLYHKVKGGLK
jgi:hypothetical protein